MVQLSIIIPTYNEVDNVNFLVKKIVSVLSRTNFKKTYELIFVDDFSTDGTISRIQRLKRKYPIKIFIRKEKSLASALIFGLKKATGKLRIIMDADLSHPPELIPSMLALSKSNDLVIASRFVKGSGIRQWTHDRKIISFTARLLAKPLTQIKDPVSGFFLVNENVIAGISLKPRSCKVLLEILCKGKPKKIVELPYVFVNRKKGVSKLDMREFINYSRHVAALLLGR